MGISKENYEKLKEIAWNTASWAVWQLPDAKPKSNMRDVSMFDDIDLSALNTGYVFVGLNGSGVHDDNMDCDKPWHNFHSDLSSGNDFKLRYALMGDDRFWGSYITDAIRYPEKDSNKVKELIKNGTINVEEHIAKLKEELNLLGDRKPILIALGNDVDDILREQLNEEYEIIKIPHYAARGKLQGQENYKIRVQEALKDCKKLV